MRCQPPFVTDTSRSPLPGTPLDGFPELCLSSAQDLMYSVLPTVKKGLCVSKALVFSLFPYVVFFGKVKQQLEELCCNPNIIF